MTPTESTLAQALVAPPPLLLPRLPFFAVDTGLPCVCRTGTHLTHGPHAEECPGAPVLLSHEAFTPETYNFVIALPNRGALEMRVVMNGRGLDSGVAETCLVGHTGYLSPEDLRLCQEAVAEFLARIRTELLVDHPACSGPMPCHRCTLYRTVAQERLRERKSWQAYQQLPSEVRSEAFKMLRPVDPDHPTACPTSLFYLLSFIDRTVQHLQNATWVSPICMYP